MTCVKARAGVVVSDEAGPTPALNTTEDTPMTKQDAYQEKIEARLERIAAEIAGLRAIADEAKADARLRLYDEIEDLQAKQQRLRERLEALRTAGDSAWEDIRTGVELAWTDLEKAFRQASKRFQ
jgi:chromosome segregation ATPase